jgi:hypothetical protein
MMTGCRRATCLPTPACWRTPSETWTKCRRNWRWLADGIVHGRFLDEQIEQARTQI